MTPAQLIGAAIVAELKRQAKEAAGVMLNHIDDEFGTANTYADGTFDFDAVGAAILDHPPCALLHVRYSDDGQHLRKWSRTPFADGTPTLAVEAAEVDLAIATVRAHAHQLGVPAITIAAEPRYLIRKRGAYYRPNAQGYTGDRAAAGRYTLAEAISHSHPNGPDGPRDGITYALDDGTEGEWR